MVRSNKSMSFIPMLLMIGVMFFYVYQCDFSFFGLPPILHSSRLSAIIIVLWAFFTPKTFKKLKAFGLAGRYYKKTLYLFVGVFIYSLFVLSVQGIGQGEHIVVNLINFFLFSVLPTFALLQIFDNEKDFFRVLLWVGIIQTFFIWLCLVNPSFKLTIDATLNKALEFERFRGLYAGGVGCITAPGLLRYATGIFACVFFILNTRKWYYYLLFTLLCLTGSMIARTGVLIAIIALLTIMVFFISNFRLKSIIQSTIIIAFIVAILSVVIIQNADFFEERFSRLFSLIEYGVQDSFLEGYFEGEDTVIPPLNSDTILGIGVTSGISGNGVRINVDGGYIRLYAALGLPIAIVFYFLLYLFMTKVAISQSEKRQRFSLFFLVVCIVVGEFKEYYILNHYIILIFFVASCLMQRESLVIKKKE